MLAQVFGIPYEFEELIKDSSIGTPFKFAELDPFYIINYRGSDKNL